MFTNILLIILGTIAAILGISFLTSSGIEKSMRASLSGMSLGVCFWCTFYGIMGFRDFYDNALLFRTLGLAGIYIFLLGELFLVLFRCHSIPISLKKCMMGIYSALTIICFLFASKSDTVTFTTYDGRVAFYETQTLGRWIHNGYILILFITLAILGLIWLKDTPLRRQKLLIRMIYASNLILILCSIPDTILPMLGKASYPSSSFGSFLALLIIWLITKKLNAFEITVENLGQYIYQLADTPLLVYDQNGRLSLANHSAVEAFGLTETNLGRGLSDIFEVSDDLSQMIFNGLTTTNEDNNLRLRDRNKGKRYVTNFTLIKDYLDETFCTMCFVYDLTREEQMILAAKQADEAKSAFLAHMSHEIRTPINVVLGMDELILRESTDPAIIDYASNIENAGKSLLTIINDILDFSKVEAGEMEIVNADYQLSSIVGDCLQMVLQKASDKGLDIRVENDPHLPSTFNGDALRIKQILINLLTNAIKYTEKGSIILEITSSNNFDVEKPINLRFAVKDTGPGIASADIPLLFEAFKRIDEKKNQTIEGTGLGLSITKRIATLMGGTIEVDSTLGEGSTFFFTLPQKIIDETPIGKLKKSHDEGRRTHKFKSSVYAPEASILVVDDVEMNLSVIKGLLKATKVLVTTALSGENALNLLEKNKYDLVFMDHMMPNMDGIETLEKLKQMGGLNASTPIIVLTANAINGAKEEYLKHGFTDYLSKPVNPVSLEQALQTYLPAEKLSTRPEETNVSDPPPLTEAIEELSTSTEASEHMLAATDVMPKDKKDKASTPISNETTETLTEESDPMWQTISDPPEEAASNDLPLQKKLPFLDIEMGLQYCMEEEFYLEIIKAFATDDKSEVIQKHYDAKDYKSYQIEVHALKGTALTIGATEVSALAKGLEQSAKHGEIEYVLANHDAFMTAYKKLLKQIQESGI